MCNLYGYVKCYDTLKQEYVLVPVEVELEIYLKQSHWKEDMQNRRYSKRTTVYDYLVPKQEEIENEKNNLINDIIRQYEIECLKEEIDKLDEKYKKIIRLVYYKELTILVNRRNKRKTLDLSNTNNAFLENHRVTQIGRAHV